MAKFYLPPLLNQHSEALISGIQPPCTAEVGLAASKFRSRSACSASLSKVFTIALLAEELADPIDPGLGGGAVLLVPAGAEKLLSSALMRCSAASAARAGDQVIGSDAALA